MDARLDTDPPSASPSPEPLRRMQRAEGRAGIVFKAVEGRTRLDRLFQEGCAKLRLPRPLPGRAPEAVLINTAGGLTGGDRIATEIELAPGTEAVVTTQACERVYRSSGDEARVETRLRIGAGARLFWLPQETILFDRGRLARRLEADLGEGAELLAIEAVVLGRTAMGETVESGAFRDRWRIRRDGRLLFADDVRLSGDIARLVARPAILDGRIAFATILHATAEPERHLAAIRAAIGEAGGASAFGGKLIARLCAEDGLTLRRLVERVLTILLEGRTLPKVWQI